MSNPRRKYPLWMRSNLNSCPNCGKLIEEYQINDMQNFDCPHCNYHLAMEDYMNDFALKIGSFTVNEDGSIER